MDLPQQLKHTIKQVHGDPGVAWIREFPNLLQEVQEQWGLEQLTPYPNLTFHFVAASGDRVLKCGVPSEELTREINALYAFNGRSMVSLIDTDADKGLMLLERLRPGIPLSSLNNQDASVRIAATVMKNIATPVDSDQFLTAQDWCAAFDRYQEPGPIDPHLLNRAQAVSKELLGSMGEPVLLHGDLHHDNILSSDADWIAIDPKGVIAEREFELSIVWNPLSKLAHERNLDRYLHRSLDILAEYTAFDRQRLHAWAFVRVVLGMVWNVEDNLNGNELLQRCAELLR